MPSRNVEYIFRLPIECSAVRRPRPTTTCTAEVACAARLDYTPPSDPAWNRHVWRGERGGYLHGLNGKQDPSTEYDPPAR